ncbi:MAG: nuclear transport factor 2 family protein [Candidatus Acidiferrum sp.]
MRNYFFVACAACLLGTSLFGQQPQDHQNQTGIPPSQQAAPVKSQAATDQTANAAASQELTNMFDAKIHAEWEAIKNKDQKAYGEFLTDDFIGVEADREGERYKWKAQAELQGSAVTNYQLSFLKVTPLCPEAAFVRYEVFINFPPKSVVRFEKLLIGEVWVKREGQWKVMHYQETKVK